jgi:formamidopyrimidine-DNA glycosylase
VPELIEVEFYRQAAERAVGRRIIGIESPDAWFLKRGLDAGVLADAVTGARVVAARRHGKLLLVDLDGRPTIGLRFGMTGRLIVDGHTPIDRLEYGSGRDDPAWDRITFQLAGGGRMRINDPRRLGGVELEPDLASLGPDAVTITPSQLSAAMSGSVALKARLLDQSRVAGIGNLIADETLWRAGLSPVRAARSLDRADLTRLVRHLRSTILRLTLAGGSHTGALQAVRVGGGSCPRCGGPLRREQVGGRTTIWCPTHQR